MPPRPQESRRSSRGPAARYRRKGAIVVLAAFLMIVMLALLALSIDTGYMYTLQTQLDRSVDAAALAGAASLVEGTDVAQEKVVEYLVRNPVAEPDLAVDEDQLPVLISQFVAEHQDDFEILLGHWNPDSGQLEQTYEIPSAVSVSMVYPNLPLFFGRALGKDSFSIDAHAIAMYQPRDIMVVLDFSGSMNDDSEFKSIDRFGKQTIMDGLQQIYQDLGSPDYGDLEFEPQYITVAGTTPFDESQPQIHVEYRYRSVRVTSTHGLTKVWLGFSNGNYQSFSASASTDEVFAGTGGNSGQSIRKIWVRSGANDEVFGYYGESFDFDSDTIRSTIKTALGLDSVDYPYPSGSWNSFIDYCRYDSTNYDAGFHYMFGYANLINYWLEEKPRHSQTPDLWKARAYPVSAVKDAVEVFLDYVCLVDTNDRVGLVVYDAADGEAVVEVPLTLNVSEVSTRANQRQAAHYHNYTNIGAGMEHARLHLQSNARTGAFKMIVLMTDGRANWHNGQYDMTGARNHVLAEAAAAADLNWPIVAISLGAGADTQLMGDVAEITESRHFNVPGGQMVEDYREDLIEVFREIADGRPLKLVQ